MRRVSRRQFLASTGGVVCAAAGAGLSLASETKLIGALLAGERNALTSEYLVALERGLQIGGWRVGINVQLEVRVDEGVPNRSRAAAADLVSLAPDLLVGASTVNAQELRIATREIPIVFVGVSDPMRIGLVQNFAAPGLNATGLTSFQPSHGGKWLSHLAEIAPDISEVRYVYNPQLRSDSYTYVSAIILAARNAGLPASTTHTRSAADIVAAVQNAASRNCGLIVSDDSFMRANLELLVELCGRHRVPAIYPSLEFVLAGGLLCYAVDLVGDFERIGFLAAQILDGRRASEIPVEAPTGYILGINLRTASAMGLSVPLTLLVAADTLIE